MTGNVEGLVPELIEKLKELEKHSGLTLYITSGRRDDKKNTSAGGVKGSAHLSGLAADIAAVTSSQKFLLVGAAYAIGFKRIGVGSTFVHVDIDSTKPQNVLWPY